MSNIKGKQKQRERRHKRVRGRIKGTSDRPRLSLFRSNRHIWVQLVDDESKNTLVSASDFEIKAGSGKMKRGERVGELISKKAIEKEIKTVVFDRGGYKYHGIVKEVADGARKGGLKL